VGERIVVEWNDERWARYPDAAQRAHRVYYQSLSRRKALHVAVWEHHHGCPVPDGYQVHHADDDPDNNDPGNLIALIPTEHAAAHDQLGTFSFRSEPEWQAHLTSIRPLAAQWHGTPDGLAWHAEHGRASWEAREPLPPQACEQCHHAFRPFHANARWCSKLCRERWHAAQGTHLREWTCEQCGETFRRRKRGTYCGNRCAAQGRVAKRRAAAAG
jgi:hypothetical protein